MVCWWTGQVHPDVDGNPVRRLCLARHCASVRRLRRRDGSYDRQVWTHHIGLDLLLVPRLLLPLHLLRRE